MPQSAGLPTPVLSGLPEGRGQGGMVRSRVLLVGAAPERVGLLGDDSDRARVWYSGIEVLEADSFVKAEHQLQRLSAGELHAILVNLVGMDNDASATLQDLQRLRGMVPFSAFIVIVPGMAPGLAEAVFQCGANDCLLGGSLTPEALARSLRFNIDRHKSQKRIPVEQGNTMPVVPPIANFTKSGLGPIVRSGAQPISQDLAAGPTPSISPLPSLASGTPVLPQPAGAPSSLETALPCNPLQYGLLVESSERLKSEVAERRRVERMLREELLRAEAANLAKSEFLARISHEIRTPMNGIIGMTELVLDTDLNSRQREYLNLVSKSAESLLTLVNDLLDFSKIEAGTIEVESELFSLRDLLADAVRSLGVAAALKGLELVLDIHPEVPFSIMGDAGRLRQVLLNLIGNAVKFTDSGGVTVSVTLKEGKSGGGNARLVLIQVADTGIGIPADKLGEIFEAFAQVDPSTTRRHTGTGLGLSITKSLVEQLGGTIDAQSKEGGGSLFEFTLPIPLGTHEDENSLGVSETPSVFKGLRALVLEAHPAAAKALNSILTELGISADTVKDRAAAGEALEAARRQGMPYKLVLVGSTLEAGVLNRVAGTRFCDAVAYGPEPRPSIILMLPPASTSAEVQRAWTHPSGCVLSKPVVQSSLRDAIYESFHTKESSIAAAATGGSGASVGSGLRGVSTIAGDDLVSDQFPSSSFLLPRRKILVVEDNLISQRVAETILSNEGYLVTVANNGKEAVQALINEPFDLVLMDLQMPEMDGLEATRAIRSLGHMRGRVPIIATTAHAIKGDRERCLEAGSDLYLPKPFHKHQLLEIVAVAINSTAGGIH